MYHSSIKCPLMFKSYQVKRKQYLLQNYFLIFSYAKKKIKEKDKREEPL